MKSYSETRDASMKAATDLGYSVNPNLPLLETNLSDRTLEQALARCLCLHVSVSCAFGFERKAAQTWVTEESLVGDVAGSEAAYLKKGIGDPVFFQQRVECLQAFAWLFGMIENLSFARECDDNLISIFPDVKRNESSREFRAGATLRSTTEIQEMLDLAYCLHWSIVDSDLSGRPRPGNVYPYVIIERRRVLEWMLSREEWDELSLDT